MLTSCILEEFEALDSDTEYSNWEDLEPRLRLDCCFDHLDVCLGSDVCPIAEDGNKVHQLTDM